MDYIQLRKRTVIKKYHESDIFNLKKDSQLNKSSRPLKNRTTQGTLEKTKDDIFNTLDNNKARRIKPRKKKIYIQNYLNTDIFNNNLNESDKNIKAKKRKNVNASSCFNGILNNEEYKTELNNYTKIHRSKKKDYNFEKYFNKISPCERYYSQLYGDEKNGIFPPNENIISKTLTNSPDKIGVNSVFRNNLKNYETRRRNYKIELNKNNEYSIDGKKKIDKNKSENKIDSFKRKKVDLYGRNLDDKNNRNIIKEKDGIKYNSKLYKQLEIQSNIFGEENKDINSKMNSYIKNKKEEENKIKLKSKTKKEKEEINNKMNEKNKKNLCLNNNRWGGTHCKWQKSNMDWKDPGAQYLFKKNNTVSNFKNNENDLTAFQRKLNDLADSDNIDTLSEIKKSLDIAKFKVKKNINVDDNNVEETKEILNTMPNNVLRLDQKIKIINGSTTSKFLNKSTNENLIKMCNRINNSIKNTRLSKNKKKNNTVIKIMGNNSHINDINKNNNNIYNKIINNDYLLIYSTKAINNFDNLNPTDIKKIFGAKGIHIFDIRTNQQNSGKINKIQFKIRENEEDNKNDLEQKIKLVENDLNNNKFKVSIKKGENMNKIKNNNIKEKLFRDINNKHNLVKRKKNLISQFPVVDHKYKRLVQK